MKIRNWLWNHIGSGWSMLEHPKRVCIARVHQPQQLGLGRGRACGRWGRTHTDSDSDSDSDSESS